MLVLAKSSKLVAAHQDVVDARGLDEEQEGGEEEAAAAGLFGRAHLMLEVVDEGRRIASCEVAQQLSLRWAESAAEEPVLLGLGGGHHGVQVVGAEPVHEPGVDPLNEGRAAAAAKLGGEDGGCEEHGVEVAGVVHVERGDESADRVLNRVALVEADGLDQFSSEVLVHGLGQVLQQAALAEASGVALQPGAE